MTQMPNISEFLHGTGGGGKGGAKNDKNTLRSNATVRFVALLSDGEIVGPTRGSKDILLDETRLQADNGRLNFQGVQWDFRSGLPDQAPFANFKGVEQETTVGVEVTNNNPVTRTLTDPDFTHCRVTIRIPALFKQTDDGMKRTSVQFLIEVRAYNGSYVDAFGVITLSGKNTSGYDKSYTIKLPQNPAPNVSYPWEVRVTRITPDADDNTKTQDMVYFASLTGIIDEQFIYPDSALLAMAISAEDFEQGLPTLAIEGDGAIIKVPSNYNPVERTYTGIWNGTFKEAYTDNPAWIYYDIVTNKRVGMGEYIPEASVDKWALYEIGAYCDQLIPDGFGGMEPRFTMAAYLTENKECYELLQLIASAFRGMSFWSSGSVTAVQDRPSDPVQLVTRANVVAGEFVYSSSSHTARHTVAHVRYMDPNDLYKSAVEVVRDPQAILRYGERVKEVNAFGCTSRGQARRLGMWILQSELYETQTVTYRAGMDHASLKPGDDILIMDERISGVDNGGRLKKYNSANNVTLDRAVTLQSGKSYSLYVMMPDGSVASSTVTGGAGTRSTLALGSALPQQPVAAAVWVLSASDVAPRPFRILANTEKDDHIFEITALQKHVPKYAFVDNSARFDAPSYRDERELSRPTNLTAREYSYFSNGVPKVGMTISWEGDPKNLASVFRVEITAPNDQDRFVYPRVSGFSVDIEDVVPGEYEIKVYTLGVSNGRSDPATLIFDARGWGEIAVPEVRNLELARPFESPDCEIKWTNFFPGGPTNNSMYKSNLVKVFSLVEGVRTLRRQEYVFEPKYTYTIDKNKLDGAPARQLYFEVTATYTVANIDRTSNAAEVSAYNPPIPAPPVRVESGFSQLMISWGTTTEPDYVKTKLWVEYESGYDPHEKEPAYEGSAGLYPFWTGNTTPRYIRVAHIDSFSEDDFLASTEVVGQALQVTIDTEAPATPTGLALTSSVLEDDPGFVQLTATWDANTEDDLAGYDIQIKEFSGNFVSFLTSENTYQWRVRPGIPVTAQVAAYDRMGNKSNYSAAVAHTTAIDDVPPAIPENVRTRSGIDVIWVEWNRNTEPDMAYYEVYVTDQVSATEPPQNTQDVYATTANSVSVSGLEVEDQRFFWVRAIDTSGNKSDWSAKVSGAAGTLPDIDANIVNIVGVVFNPGQGESGNTLTWTAGQAIYGSEPTVEELDEGFATWFSGTLFVYYVKGQTTLSTTTNLPSVYAANGTLVGVYKGGLNFNLSNADSYVNGGLIIARTIGADQLAIDQAVITGSAQIANAVIGTAHVSSLSAAKLEAGTIMSGGVIIDGRSTKNLATTDKMIDAAPDKWVMGNGTTTSYAVSDAANVKTGEQSLVVRAEGNGWFISPEKMLVEQGKVYKAIFRVRRSTGTEGGLYLGFVGYAGDKISQVGINGNGGSPHHYFAASNLAQSTVPNTFTEYVAYFRLGTETAGNLGTGLANLNKLAGAVRYISPMTIVNYNLTEGGCVMVIDSCSIEVMTEEAADLVNAGTTQIEPGKIRIAGGTTLADWRSGGDLTEINGGKISANTIDANKLTVGQRGAVVEGIQFEHNSPGVNQVSWTAGTIRIVGDDGNYQTFNIAAGSNGWTTGTIYVYWVKGSNILNASPDVQYALMSDRLAFAAYRGGTDLVTEYGRTVIDGAQIKTGTIKAEQADLGSLRAGILVAGAINSSHIAANSITAKHMAIVDYTNLVPDGDLVDPDIWNAAGWAITNPTTTSVNVESPGQLTWTSGVYNYGKEFTVYPGVEYYMSYQAARLAGAQWDVWAELEWIDKSGTLISRYQVRSGIISTGGVFKFSGNTVAPAYAVRARWRWAVVGANTTATSIGFWAPTVRMKSGAELIVDGSITAQKISVTNLSSINSNLGTATAGSLNINNLFVVASNGQTTIRSATSGARMQINNNRIDVYDASGVLRCRLGQL